MGERWCERTEAEVERLREPGPPELTWSAHNALVLRIGALNTQNERLQQALKSARDWMISAQDDANAVRSTVVRVLEDLTVALEPAQAEEDRDA